MPEGPEAEICRRQLERWTGERRVVDVVLPDPACVRHKRSTHPRDAHPTGEAWLKALIGSTVRRVSRHGKRIGWEWENSGLLLHLGMTGKWVQRARLDEVKYLRAAFQMEGGHWVCFVDARRFGGIVPVMDTVALALREGLGPDALDERLTGEQLAGCFAGRRPIKVALMDQSCLAGLGNIHAVEILWLAGIHPETPVSGLTRDSWARLAGIIPAHLASVVTAQDGEEMAYITQGGANSFAVYGRAGGICPRCSQKIQSKNIQGRNTFFCISCQVL